MDSNGMVVDHTPLSPSLSMSMRLFAAYELVRVRVERAAVKVDGVYDESIETYSKATALVSGVCSGHYVVLISRCMCVCVCVFSVAVLCVDRRDDCLLSSFPI
jgi:hypothetical protein